MRPFRRHLVVRLRPSREQTLEQYWRDTMNNLLALGCKPDDARVLAEQWVEALRQAFDSAVVEFPAYGVVYLCDAGGRWELVKYEEE